MTAPTATPNTQRTKRKYRLYKNQGKALRVTDRILAITAGTGWGKTFFGRFWLIKQIKAHPGADGLVVSPSFPNYNATMLNGVVPWLVDEIGYGTFNKVEKCVELHASLGGGKIYFRSAEAPLSMEGIHAGFVWMDEPGQADDLTWEIVQRRVGLSKGPILLTGYPLSATGWYRDLFDSYTAGEPGIAVIQGASTDRPDYPRDEFERMKRQLPDWKFRQRYLGEFARAQGAILPPAVVEELPEEKRAKLQLYGGADYGVWFAGAVIGWIDDECWILGAYKAEEQTYGINANGLKAIGFDKTTRNYGDSAATAAWPEFRKYGIKIQDAVKGQGSVLAGIERMVEMVNNRKLKIAKGCIGQVELLKEWDAYRWHTDPDSGNRKKDEPVKENDHILDSIRYAITNSRPATRTGRSIAGAER